MRRAGRDPAGARPAARGVGGYELIAGERRWRAAREAGAPTVPAVVRAADDRDTLLLGLVENVAREQLSPVEEARAYAVLIDEFELSLGDVAERVGRSKPSVSNRHPPARAPRRRARDGRARRADARATRAPSSPCPTTRAAAASRARSCERGLSVRAAEQRAKWAGAKTAAARRARARSIRRSPRACATRSSSSPACRRASSRGRRRARRSPTSTTSPSSSRRSSARGGYNCRSRAARA